MCLAESLAPAGTLNVSHIEVPDGWRLVYKRGSILGIYRNGILCEREILEPAPVELPEAAPTLYYMYPSPEGGLVRTGLGSFGIQIQMNFVILNQMIEEA